MKKVIPMKKTRKKVVKLSIWMRPAKSLSLFVQARETPRMTARPAADR